MRALQRLKSQLVKHTPRTSFVRNVSILAGGTALAQALTMLALPIITRIYTPEDFSVLAVYSALLGIIAVVSSLRLEIAIPLPNEDFEAANLMVLGLVSNIVIGAMVLFLVSLFPGQIVNSLGQPDLQSYLWLLPVGVWLSGIFTCVQYWATRSKRFGDIAQSRISQSASSVLVQIIFGSLTRNGPLGLLLGQVAANGAGLFKLGRVVWVDMNTHWAQITCATLRNTFKKYSKFPKFSTIESLSNIGSLQLPIIIISATAVGPEVGFAFLAMKAAGIPISLIGKSISQVYLSCAPDELRAGKLSDFTQKITAGLIGAGVGPLVCFGILAPDLMPMVFGPKWARAGEIVAWMTPWFVFQYLASPISMALHVTGRQRLAMINQIWGLALRVCLTAWAAFHMNEYIVEIYSLSGAFFYLGYILIILKVSGVNFLSFAITLKRQVLIISTWVGVGVIIKTSAGFISI
jgi:O-antigen/teichoic acid export membrane protein